VEPLRSPRARRLPRTLWRAGSGSSGALRPSWPATGVPPAGPAPSAAPPCRTRTAPRSGRARALTVDGVHTYYVVAGDTPVLVHNCGQIDDVSRKIADHANGEALRPNGDGTHFVRGVHEGPLRGRRHQWQCSKRWSALSRARARRYWDPDKRAVVIEDGDAGTVFTPRGGENWFDNVLK
jgi:hypothetical protein